MISAQALSAAIRARPRADLHGLNDHLEGVGVVGMAGPHAGLPVHGPLQRVDVADLRQE